MKGERVQMLEVGQTEKSAISPGPRTQLRHPSSIRCRFCVPKARRQSSLPPIGCLLLSILPFFIPCATRGAEPIRYVVNLTAPETHLVQVTMSIPDASPGTKIQIPAWNCLYQIRDFVKDVQDLKADCDGQPAELDRLDQNTWSGPRRTCGTLAFHYLAFENTDGPFDSMLNSHHAFLNLAMVLFYLPLERNRPVQVKFKVAMGWKLASLLEGAGDEFRAADYDQLVDSPVEAGHFQDFSYRQTLPDSAPGAVESKSATIRVIIDGDSGDYSSSHILSSLEKITAEETSLMQDLPFSRYTFILHFPREGGSTGGMEHGNGAAIAVAAADNRNSHGYLESVAAHELFHAWNVKRIRPQRLEPVDYINGNDTRDLWFCEGVTNSYAQLTLLRSELIDRDAFYRRLASAIQILQSHNSRGFQSAETSGREAWLEKYSDYNRSPRSISYYNKGELLGYLLDLGIRQAGRNRAGLDDVMRRLNQDFARQGRFYTMNDLNAIIAQLAPAFDMNRFLAEDVRGTQELNYSTYLEYAGLRLTTQATGSPAQGFFATRNARGLLQVDSIDGGSDAERAGLLPGDVLIKADGNPLPAGSVAGLPPWRAGQAVELQVRRGGGKHVVKFRVGADQEISYQIDEDPLASREQLRVREGWLRGVTNPSAGKP